MEKASMEMDLEEWEFLDVGPESGKGLLSKELRLDPRKILDVNYFVCPPKDSGQQFRTAPIPRNSVTRKILDDEVVAHGFKDIQVTSKILDDEVVAHGFKDIQVVPPMISSDRPPQAFLKKSEKESGGIIMSSKISEFVGVEEQKSSKISELDEDGPAKEEYKAPEKKAKNWWEEFGLGIWRWRLNCSMGVAAATICMFLLGGRQHHHQNQKLQLQIYDDDKRMMQVVQQAARLNRALLAARSAPMTRAHISFGGYYDGL